MNTKYLFVGGIALVAIFALGIGLYMFSNQDQQKETLGAQNINQMSYGNTGQNKENNKIIDKNKSSNMQPEEFKTAIESGDYTLIDIRTEEEYLSGHIAGSTQSDFYQTQEFSNFLETLDKNEKYLIYCRSGNRSNQVLNIMKNKGFTDVSDLAGGISAWTAAGFPVE